MNQSKILVLVKTYKATSSMATGGSPSHRQLAWHPKGTCSLEIHLGGIAYYQSYPQNNNQTFFLTAIRNPASRGMSRFFFTQVSCNRSSTEDETIIKFLEESPNKYPMFLASSPQGGYQIV
jgi:hypothetical protein